MSVGPAQLPPSGPPKDQTAPQGKGNGTPAPDKIYLRGREVPTRLQPDKKPEADGTPGSDDFAQTLRILPLPPPWVQVADYKPRRGASPGVITPSGRSPEAIAAERARLEEAARRAKLRWFSRPAGTPPATSQGKSADPKGDAAVEAEIRKRTGIPDNKTPEKVAAGLLELSKNTKKYGNSEVRFLAEEVRRLPDKGLQEEVIEILGRKLAEKNKEADRRAIASGRDYDHHRDRIADVYRNLSLVELPPHNVSGDDQKIADWLISQAQGKTGGAEIIANQLFLKKLSPHDEFSVLLALADKLRKQEASHELEHKVSPHEITFNGVLEAYNNVKRRFETDRDIQGRSVLRALTDDVEKAAAAPLPQADNKVNHAYDTITGELTVLRGFGLTLDPKKLTNVGDRPAFQAQVARSLRAIYEGTKELTREQVTALVGKLEQNDLEYLAFIESSFRGLVEDYQKFETKTAIFGVNKDILVDPAPSLFLEFAGKVDSGEQMHRLLNAMHSVSQDQELQAMQSVSQDQKVQASPEAAALTGWIVGNQGNGKQQQTGTIGKPNYHKYIVDMGKAFQEGEAKLEQKVALINGLAKEEKEELKLKDGVSYPQFIDGGSTDWPIGRTEFGDARAAVVANLIGSLNDHTERGRAAIKYVFKNLSIQQLQRIANSAMQGFRKGGKGEADPTPLRAMIAATTDPGLLGNEGTYGVRNFVYAKMFTVVAGALDNYVINKFYSPNSGADIHLFAAQLKPVQDITKETLAMMMVNPQGLMSGLGAEEGQLETGSAMSRFTVYLQTIDMMEKHFAEKTEETGLVPLISYGGPLYDFWNALWGDFTTPLERAEFFMSGKPPGHVGLNDVDVSIVRENIARFVGYVIGGNAATQHLFDHEMYWKAADETTVNGILNSIPVVGDVGKAVQIVVAMAKGAVGYDAGQTSIGYTKLYQNFDSRIGEENDAMYQLLLPSPDIIIRTHAHIYAARSSGSVRDSRYYQKLFSPSLNKVAAAYKRAVTFGGYNLNQLPGTQTFQDAEQGTVELFYNRGKRYLQEWGRQFPKWSPQLPDWFPN
jgi:hypothetical protein